MTGIDALTADSCEGIELPDASDKQPWLELAISLRDAGELEKLHCLKRVYEQRFNTPLDME